jgi:hypothetical protein
MVHYWKQHEILLSEAKELMESKNLSVKKVNKAGRVRMKVTDTPLPASPAKKEASGSKKFIDDESWAAIKRLSGEFKEIDHKFVIPATLLSWVLIYIDFNTTIVSGQLLDMVVKREVTFEELLPKGYTIILSNLLSFMINVRAPFYIFKRTLSLNHFDLSSNTFFLHRLLGRRGYLVCTC